MIPGGLNRAQKSFHIPADEKSGPPDGAAFCLYGKILYYAKKPLAKDKWLESCNRGERRFAYAFAAFSVLSLSARLDFFLAALFL